MSVECPHEGEASDASRSTKGLCPFDAERELRDEPGGDWDPEPAELREGETRDDSAHAAANREMIRRARIEGVVEDGDRE